MNSKFQLSIPQRVKVALAVAKGLAYLHSKVVSTAEDGTVTVIKPRIIHRDLKAANVLIKSDLSVIRIADFGLSRELSSVQAAHTNAGTPGMQAPEVAVAQENNNDQGYTHKADVFSYGMLIYEVLTGKQPFFTERDAAGDQLYKTDHAVRKAIREGKQPSWYLVEDIQDSTISFLVEIMKRCTLSDPDNRPTMEQIVQEIDSLAKEQPMDSEKKKRHTNEEETTEQPTKKQKQSENKDNEWHHNNVYKCAQRSHTLDLSL